MEEINYIEEIYAVEKQAEEIIENSRIKRETDTEIKRQEALVLIENAKTEASKKYKEIVLDSKRQGEELFNKAKLDSINEAVALEGKSLENKDEAINKIIEGIVKFCVNS